MPDAAGGAGGLADLPGPSDAPRVPAMGGTRTVPVPDPVALEELGERWRPHRSSAARVLWHGYLGRRGRVETPHDLLDDLPD